MTKDEIEEVLQTMDPNKALGADGFLNFFFHKFWHRIKYDVIHAMQYFFLTGVIPLDWNRTFITLIPKKPNPKLAIDFQPISLCTTYKIVAKLLVQRLQPILPHLIFIE